MAPDWLQWKSLKKVAVVCHYQTRLTEGAFPGDSNLGSELTVSIIGVKFLHGNYVITWLDVPQTHFFFLAIQLDYISQTPLQFGMTI